MQQHQGRAGWRLGKGSSPGVDGEYETGCLQQGSWLRAAGAQGESGLLLNITFEFWVVLCGTQN